MAFLDPGLALFTRMQKRSDISTEYTIDWAHPISQRENGCLFPCRANASSDFNLIAKVLPVSPYQLTECKNALLANQVDTEGTVRTHAVFCNNVHFSNGTSQELFIIVMKLLVVHPNPPVVPATKAVNLQEYVENHRPRRLSEAEALRIIRRVALALARIHAAGVVHRDVKPDNIMFDGDFTKPCLIDFGWSRVIADGRILSKRFGHMVYGPPERESGNYDYGADVFSLGATLFFMLSGHTPYYASHPAEKLDLQHVQGIMTFAPFDAVSANTKDLILKMLEPTWQQRPTLHNLLTTHACFNPPTEEEKALAAPLPLPNHMSSGHSLLPSVGAVPAHDSHEGEQPAVVVAAEVGDGPQARRSRLGVELGVAGGDEQVVDVAALQQQGQEALRAYEVQIESLRVAQRAHALGHGSAQGAGAAANPAGTAGIGASAAGASGVGGAPLTSPSPPASTLSMTSPSGSVAPMDVDSLGTPAALQAPRITGFDLMNAQQRASTDHYLTDDGTPYAFAPTLRPVDTDFARAMLTGATQLRTSASAY